MAGPSHGVVEEPVKHAGDSQTSDLLPKVNLGPSMCFSIINKAALPTWCGSSSLTWADPRERDCQT